MHGGMGMTDQFDIGFFMKRARVCQELFGDSNFHADQLARREELLIVFAVIARSARKRERTRSSCAPRSWHVIRSSCPEPCAPQN